MSVATAFATNLLREITPRVHIAARPSHRRRWVAKSTDHDYADAQRRGNGVTLFASENTGAMSSGLIACLRALGKRSLLPTTQDSTCYGESSSSPQSFYAHHAAAISAAIVSADADTVANKASSLSVLLSAGIGV